MGFILAASAIFIGLLAVLVVVTRQLASHRASSRNRRMD